MITKQKLGPITVTVVDDESDLWLLEEPPEPMITATKESGHWVVFGDEYADHPDFEERWWPRTLYGDDGHHRDEAVAYAKKWARAVRGVYEEI